jgi:hypothetical protein
MRSLTATALVSALFLTPVAVRAQSLGDLAQKEEARRKDTKSGTKVYSNRDLPNVSPAEPAPAASAPATPNAAATPPPAADPPDDPPAAGTTSEPAAASRPADRPPDEGKEREKWQQRMRALREQLERNRVLADALQTRLNSLDADFVNRDDPAQRSKVAADRDRTAVELNRLKKVIAADEKAIPALEEEARRAGVPPGWLR